MISATSDRYYAASPYEDSDALRSEPREPGARRRKLAGYLKAANELRQTYQQHYARSWGGGGGQMDYPDGDDTPGAFPDAAIVRNGDEEMVLFPSYARHHVKRKPSAVPGTIQEQSGAGRDVRDTTGAGDAEFWKKEWEKHEDDSAIVDVDVRGWIYSPHRGQMTRRHRLFVGLARQLVGLPAPSSKSSGASSRDPSPARSHVQEEELIEKEAMTIMKKGENEAAKAERGGYSEDPARSSDSDSAYGSRSRPASRPASPVKDGRRGRMGNELTPADACGGSDDAPGVGIRKQSSWISPSQMNPAELQTANNHLMSRLKPFLANPLANTPISVFFYNDKISRQRTIYTDNSGHFSVRAALEFVPTHVRILASEHLSATTEVVITEPRGISLISDIDDTIKHSAISSGAREIFRNAFIRELGDLTIDGVREWYNIMFDRGVKFHYVSNSPWQLFPVIQKYFRLAGLPPGSFHLKQYSGMLQGIFEPVAERKKATLDRLARDFPERSFILVGDSGEADLEVYTDFVLDNPGRVVAVFIRDVTTSPRFFDSSMGPMAGEKGKKSRRSSRVGTRSARSSKASEDDDPELRAAILASLRDMKQSEGKYDWTPSHSPNGSMSDAAENRPALPTRRPTEPPAPEAHRMSPNLIDLSDDDDSNTVTAPPFTRAHSDPASENSILSPIEEAPLQRRNAVKRLSGAPVVPRKPMALRSPSQENLQLLGGRQSPVLGRSPSPRKRSPVTGGVGKPPPPPIRRPSTSVKAKPARSGSPLSQPPHVPELPRDVVTKYANSTGLGTGAAGNRLGVGGIGSGSSRPATATAWKETNWGEPTIRPVTSSASTTTISSSALPKKTPPPPPPPRRTGTSGSVGSSSGKDYMSSHLSNNANSAMQNSRQPYSSSSNNNYYEEPPPGLPLTKRTTNSSQISVGSTASYSNGGGGSATGGGSGSKREELWRKRWNRAQSLLAERGVVLRAWRVGADVSDEAARLIEECLERQREERRDSEGRELLLGRGRRLEG
ncbi:uncharacterized protein K452DRAFT_307376 [Aplosporella prunicola CBS 121167]|uniref:Phosphatidate phosphatase APP1 catalytic domain-containing protein n=1 Tax=Aplosporella prunicola CBS 121167 TaxID=1176127 RepID=A0A6A6BIR7_9PEZI|nr:uncharacterized protein K452DRAFT_307376 [Aplosporella prunicola CBS 121167]KAF2143205.1 hypothetical protein K452DRAFT_307376 [Aplosporella prunicola CBS 121167]